MTAHVDADRTRCIGAGLCLVADERTFDQDDDGLVVLLDATPADTEELRRAIATCPSGALSLR